MSWCLHDENAVQHSGAVDNLSVCDVRRHGVKMCETQDHLSTQDLQALPARPHAVAAHAPGQGALVV
eukprot:1968257-Prorocentrum_lima.AAC.1